MYHYSSPHKAKEKSLPASFGSAQFLQDNRTSRSENIQRKIIQRMPVHDEQGWTDNTIDDAQHHESLLQLIQTHLATYEGYNHAQLLQLFPILKANLNPAELRSIIGDQFKTTVTNLPARLNIKTIRLPGITQQSVNTNIADANAIFRNFNIEIHVASSVAVTQEDLNGGITGLSAAGNYARGTTAQDSWNLIGRYMEGNLLPVLWVPDFTGYGWMGKPNGITKELHAAQESRTMVILKSGESGQVLAHEMGHAMGGISPNVQEENQHGKHVNEHLQLNLMHGDPIINSIHKNLRREQIAAFKGSRFITAPPAPAAD